MNNDDDDDGVGKVRRRKEGSNDANSLSLPNLNVDFCTVDKFTV